MRLANLQVTTINFLDELYVIQEEVASTTKGGDIKNDRNNIDIANIFNNKNRNNMLCL